MGISAYLDSEGDLVLVKTNRRTRQRPKIGNLTAPSIGPLSPSVDNREGGSWVVNPGDFGIQVTKYRITVYRRSAEGELLDSDTTVVTAGNQLTGTYPEDAGGDHYSAGVVAVQTLSAGDRESAEVLSDDVAIVANETAPLFTVDPVISGADALIGTEQTCDGGTVTGTPTPDKTLQWLLDGVEIADATSSGFTPDLTGSLTCRVTATSTTGTAVAVSNAVEIVSGEIEWPADIVEGAGVSIEETSTEGSIGTRRMKVGAAAPGGIAVPFDEEAFIPVRASALGAPVTFLSDANATFDPATDTIDFTSTGTEGQVRYHALGAVLRADPTQFRILTTGTKTIGDVEYPALTVVIQGLEVEPPPPLDPIAALGTPDSTFKSVAVAGQLCGPGSSDTAMNSVYSASSMMALGLAVLKGDTGTARDRAVTQAKRWLAPATTPLNRAGFGDNVCNLGSFLLTAMKIDGDAFDLLTATEQSRADDCMTVHANSGVFVMSDSNPWPTKNRTICGWPTASQGQNQKTTAPNQSLMGPCSALIAMAYFGGPAALKTVLTDNTPAEVRASLVSHGLSGSNLHDTMNWRSLGHTSPIGLTVGGASTDAPTDAQIIAAISGSPRYFGVDLADYHKILAMLTYLRPAGANNTPWIANGNYGDGKYSQNPADPDAPVLIGRGWGGYGLSAAGAPVATEALAFEGCITRGRADPPGMGLVGAPAELFAWQDGSGKRASLRYTVEGMRPLLAAWAALWCAGLLNKANADISPIIPIMDRAVKVTEYAHGGWNNWDTAGKENFPTSDDWQIGALYECWTDVLYPALAA